MKANLSCPTIVRRSGWVMLAPVAAAAALWLGPMGAAQARAVHCTNCATSSQASVIISSLNTGFTNLATAIQGASAANTASAEGTARVIAEANAHTQSEIERSRSLIRYQPLDPCGATAMVNSAPGGSQDVARNRGSTSGRSATGVPRGDAVRGNMRQALEVASGVKPAPAPEISAAVASQGACETFVASNADTPRARACRGAQIPQRTPNPHPDADVRAETLFDGPQRDAGQIVRRLTYRQDTHEHGAMEAYLRNLAVPIDLRELSKAEVQTEAGRIYMALRDTYEAMISLATKPARDQARMMRADENTKDIINQLLNSDDAPFVRDYLSRAYPDYQRDGISFAELINLEAERRYRNPKWMERMASASDRQLLQEQVQMQAFQIWQMNLLLDRVQQLAIVQGQTAASATRTERLPGLIAAHRAAQR